MSEENRFVAQFWGLIAPFVNNKKDIKLMLDGSAAMALQRKGKHPSGVIPDMIFTLVGRPAKSLVEAKTVTKKANFLKVEVQKSQIKAWTQSGTTDCPSMWIGATKDFKEFFLWNHEVMIEVLKNSQHRSSRPSLDVPRKKVRRFKSMQELALTLLCELAR